MDVENHLIRETSPYLLMHAHNPVNWYPWNEETLAKAKAENKPILLSIGYLACHWCHVMAHESFENDETADLMNKHFINIKVDREERPDLDKIYQLSYQLLTQQPGGWPLTIFLTPDTHIPFFAGTYFPKERRAQYPSFKEVLHYVNLLFTEHHHEIQKQNLSFQNILQNLNEQTKEQASQLNLEPLKVASKQLKDNFDSVNGGFNTAPKFPMPTYLNRLFFNAVFDADESAKNMLIQTLEHMAVGGIYDQLGNGFFRYTVDERWQIPHFEKMLYDNAQLLFMYSQTYAKYNLPLFYDVMRGIAEWLLTDLASQEGGFYSTLSADTEGEEGKFYRWSRDEIQKNLSTEEYYFINSLYGLESPPNFEGYWHLHSVKSIDKITEETKQQVSIVSANISSARHKLLCVRNKRRHPDRDEKIIVAWNGLAIKALAFLALQTSSEHYIAQVHKAIDFIQDNLWQNKKLYSTYKDNNVKGQANLDDFVFLIEGIFYSLQAKWRTKDLIFLQELLANVLQDFEDKDYGGFYFTARGHEKLIYRLKQYSDDALPASGAVFTLLLTQLGYFLGEEHYLRCAEKSLKNAFPSIEKYPLSHATFLNALEIYLKPTQIIIVRGKKDELEQWRKTYLDYYRPDRATFFIPNEEELPNFLGEKKGIDSGVIVYYCHDSQCRSTITRLQDFEDELRSN